MRYSRSPSGSTLRRIDVNSEWNGFLQALDLLQSCSRANSESIDQLDTLRREALALSEKIQSERRALAAIYPKQDPNSRQVKARARHQRYCSATRPHADVEPILSRPRPKVSGRRRVPVLVNARGVPFFRIKKPQPRSLSRAIGSKLDNRWNRILRRERLEAELAMARDEDRWDEYVGETVTQSWTVPVLVSLKEVRNQIRASDDENARLAKEMWEVVLKERELAEKEKWERKHERRQRQLARREARRAAAVENSGHINGAEDGDQQDPKPAT